MSDKEIQSIVMRAEDEYERMKDSVHDLYDENKELKKEIERLNNIINNPEDLTLCRMWADTKLQEKNEELMSLYTSERYVKEDYKSRNNKAIEYIKYWTQDGGIILSWESVIKILEGEEVE